MSPIASLALQLLTIVAVLLILRKLAPRLETLCADHGAKSIYHRCAGIMPGLIIIGIAWSVIGFTLKLVLQGIAK